MSVTLSKRILCTFVRVPRTQSIRCRVRIMAAVKAELHFRSGEKRLFSEPAGEGDADPNLSTTHKSILKIQKDVNDALTELVNAEKAAGPQGDAAVEVGDDSSGSADEEDEEDDEEKKNGTSNNSTDKIDSEPATKKLKP